MTTSEWETHIYKKLKLKKDDGNFKPLKIDNKNYKEVINELLSFISKFRNYNFIHGDLKLSNILYDNKTHKFMLINLIQSKFKSTILSNDEYYYDLTSLYFDLCKLNNNKLTKFLQNEIIKYIPYNEIYKLHNVSNKISYMNELIALYE